MKSASGNTGDTARLLDQYRDFLPTLFGVSEVELTEGNAVAVERAAGTRCERCWRFVPSVNEDGLCPRCVDALAQPVSL